MKNRILTYIIGILTGAIVTTSVFLLYTNTIYRNIDWDDRNNREQNIRIPNQNLEEPPEKPYGDFKERTHNEDI